MKPRIMLSLLIAVALLSAGCGSDQAVGQSRADAADTAAADGSVGAGGADDDSGADDSGADDSGADDTDDDTGAAGADDDSGAVADAAVDETEAGDAPQRIVSLNPTGTEMLFAVGAGQQVVAVDSLSYYPPEAPVVAEMSAYDPSVEAIAEFEPDLVVTAAPIEGLDAVGVDVLQLDAAVTLDDVYAQIAQIGAVTGHIGEADEVVAQMRAEIDAVLASLPDRDAPLTYYHELDNTLYSVTSSTFIGHIYGLLGLENVADAADPDGGFYGYPQLNEEFLVTADPDMIFLGDTICCAQTAAAVGQRPGWNQLRAVQNGNVIEMNDDVVSRWGPRLVEFIETAGAAVAEIETASAG